MGAAQTGGQTDALNTTRGLWLAEKGLVSTLDLGDITRVLVLWRLVVAPLLVFILGGCQSPMRHSYLPPRAQVTAPTPVVKVDEPMSIVPAQPITPALPLPREHTEESNWPSNWFNVWIPLESWCQFNGLAKPARLSGGLQPTFQVRMPDGTLSVRVGTRIISYGGLQCWLNQAPQLVRDTPYIHWLDARKTLQPLLTNAVVAPQHQPTVVLDPGHGGKDVGTRNCVNGHFEKDYTLDWAMRLRPLLEANGWKVVLTRTSDVDLALSNRVLLAEQLKADLFLSLHFNSGEPNRELSGLETYCLTPHGMTSHLVRGYEDDPKQLYPNNAFDEQNYRVAFALHRAVLGQTQAADRGLRRARFMTVLRGQNRPAVLIEAGYLSNPNEARRIATPAYRQSLAAAVAQAVQGLRLPESTADYAIDTAVESGETSLR